MRFFVSGSLAIGERVLIEGADAHKIVHVLRLRAGDTIEIIDSAATAFVATIESHEPRVEVRLTEGIVSEEHRESALHVDLAQAVPKGQKMDFVVEKATELGAGAILPFYSERTVVHDLGGAKLERWRRLAKTAAQQCGRLDIPPIADVLSFASLLDRMREYDRILFAWELAPRIPLRERLAELLTGVQRTLIVIGPEGGFTHEEAEAAEKHGAELVWLGRRILRTETAALALLAVIDVLAPSP